MEVMPQSAVNRLMDRFHEEIDYMRKEYDMTYSDILGALAMLRREIEDEWINGPDDDDVVRRADVEDIEDEDDEESAAETWRNN